MKANPDRFQFIILWNTDSHTFQIGDIITKSGSSVTLLGITIDLKRTYQQCYKKGIV